MARIGRTEPVAHVVTVEGHGPLPLGAWSYKFHRAHDRLPTTAECRLHAAGRKVMVRT